MDTTVKEIAWSDKLNTDVTSIDLQHKRMAYRLENLRLFERMTPIPDCIFEEYLTIIDEIETHFSYEEAIMANIHCDNFDAHCMSHQNILNKLYELRDEVILTKDFSRIHEAISLVDKMIAGHLSHEDSNIKKVLHRSLPN
ncbi:hemerythrin domain-containing protein [Terasakiella sp. A23]|uniref:bacteriohemerythrin n=1 Tax=Terasakiella sp. FCG-A23 TaxID=3080561 RepID=UPI002952B0F9|nr:hemerythrin domain-containing protein [Terasakiella sp. A23]MDV7339638.1 hemerythrin domain-containing protein [Terasakiella sp. A23]